MGLDELFVYKRIAPRGTFRPIPVYVTANSWEVIGARFGYLERMGVIQAHPIEPGKPFDAAGLEVFPFKTDHGGFAKGSVGFVIRFPDPEGGETRLAYTSDFKDLPHFPGELLQPDYLVIQSFWLNEPVNNRPSHMSFQRAMGVIERVGPKRRTFLVHMGDADAIPGDPANVMTKKYEPLDPLRSLSDGKPYPIPLCHLQWQQTVDQILWERKIPFKVTVAHDGLEVSL
ncbi:MAG: MBL fold metallo-hydrolase [Deltaproteobacteria bacterium]